MEDSQKRLVVDTAVFAAKMDFLEQLFSVKLDGIIKHLETLNGTVYSQDVRLHSQDTRLMVVEVGQKHHCSQIAELNKWKKDALMIFLKWGTLGLGVAAGVYLIIKQLAEVGVL